MAAKKKVRKPSEFTKQLLGFIDQYEKETGDLSGNMTKVAQWLYNKNMMDPPPFDPIKAIAKRLTNAMRQDYIEDENKQPIRRRHAYPVKGPDEQLTFAWFKIEEATPEKMRLSAQGRRTQSLLDMLQLVRDVNYYNNHYNPGDAIQVDANFMPDIEELSMPSEYPDSPPEDHDDDDDTLPASPVS